VAATADLFTTIHKALRSMLYSLSSRLQTNDFADVAATRSLVVDLENDFAAARSAGCVLCVLAQHATDEERVIFPAAAGPEAALIASLIADHHDLTRREGAIESAAHELLAVGTPEGRVEAGVRLNQAVNELIVAYLAHMNREETELVPRMREHITDAQQVQMRGAIMGAMPRDRLFAILGWMLPSLNVTELAGVLSSVLPNSPPPVVQAVTELCDAKVDPARWTEVRRRIAL
jgi:Hemerythrin HHE cation binding domain